MEYRSEWVDITFASLEEEFQDVPKATRDRILNQKAHVTLDNQEAAGMTEEAIERAISQSLFKIKRMELLKERELLSNPDNEV